MEPSGKISKSKWIGSLHGWSDFRKTGFVQTLFSWISYFRKYENLPIENRKALYTTTTNVFEVNEKDLLHIPKRTIGTRINNQWAVHDEFIERPDEAYARASHARIMLENPTEDTERASGAGLTDGKPMGALSDVRLWHNRFNHPGITYMKIVNKREGLGLKNKDIDAFYNGACCVGCLGKIQKAIHKISTPKLYDEVWSVDLLGPYHPSLDDERYTAIFVEHRIGDLFHQHLMKKNDYTKLALPGWMEYRKQCLQLYNREKPGSILLRAITNPQLKNDFSEDDEAIKYTRLRADNAGSLTEKPAKAFMKKNNVILETCAAGSDDHASQAEAAIKAIQRMSLCALFGAKLDLIFLDANKKKRTFFTYAIDMAVAIKKHLPYAGNGRKSPFEAIRGRPATELEIRSLRTPFSTAYCKVDTTNARQKKYKIGILVGYDIMGKYKIMFPHRLKLKAQKRKHRTMVIRSEKQIRWDESLTHTVNRFDELVKYHDFAIMYDTPPVIDKKLIDKSIPTDRVTRRQKKLADEAAALEVRNQEADKEAILKVASLTNQRIKFAEKNIDFNNKSAKRHEPTTTKVPRGIIKRVKKHQEAIAMKAREVDLPAHCERPVKGTSQLQCPDCFQTNPKNWDECMKRPDRQIWIDALQAEKDGFDGPKLPKKRIKRIDRSTVPKDSKIVRGSIVFTIKWDSVDGNLVYNKHKIRIVGNATLSGAPSFSPTVAFTPQLMLLTIAAVLDLDVWLADAKQAYLGTWLPDDHPPVYIHVPRCARNNPKEIWQSLVAIYGMEIAGRLFYLRVKKALIQLGMTESKIFQATYRFDGETRLARLSKFSNDSVQIFIATHVDDFIFVSTDDSFRKRIMEELKMTFTFGSNDLITTLLGLEITRNRAERTMEINCGAKIRDMLKRYGLDARSSKAETPHYVRQKFSSLQCPPEDQKLDKLEFPYLSLLMTIAWIAMHCRIELLFILSILRQYQQNPGMEHFKGLVRVCDYLRTYPDLTLKIGGCKNALEVVYDASFANLEDGHSTGAVLIRFYGTPIRIWVKKLSFADIGKCSTSTTKAEVKTAAVACEELDIVTNYIKEMGIDKLTDLSFKHQRYNGQASDRLPHLDCSIHEGLKNIPFYGDNRAVNGALTGTQKADALRSIKTWGGKVNGSHKAGITFLRESCEAKDVMHCYITDVDNCIDVLTKFKDGPTFHRHSRVIRGHDEIDFTKTIEIEERLHKKATARKVYKRKLDYQRMKPNLKDIGEEEDNTTSDHVAAVTYSSANIQFAPPYDYDYDQ